MSPAFSRFILTKVLGWSTTPPGISEKHVVILGVPHTSIWDFLIGYMYYRSYGGKMKTMIKKEAFFWPFSWILRSLGGFPVDRSNSTSLLVSLIREMNNSETFHLVICPEGTRKAVHKWKTGYHTIARQTDSPVYMGYFDWEKKRVGIAGRFELTENAREDTDRLQAEYERMHLPAKFPENYTTK